MSVRRAPRRSLIAVSALSLLIPLAAACGSSSDDTGTAASADTATPAPDTASGASAAAADAKGVTIDGAWARTSPALADNGAAYFTMRSAAADRLISVQVDTSVAAEAQIHETVAATMGTGAAGSTMTGDSMGDGHSMGTDDSMSGAGDMAGAMRMQQVTGIDLPAGELVTLEPGGYHIMLLDLAEPLVAGETFELTLGFDHAPDQVVSVTVGDSAP
ncbi:MAG: copper chaperone PCu(A)C [Acidimicrobiia bacterium]|nr:copper chaperone PCu(A)C [Acidimicrobiia bacterium]